MPTPAHIDNMSGIVITAEEGEVQESMPMRRARLAASRDTAVDNLSGAIDGDTAGADDEDDMPGTHRPNAGIVWNHKHHLVLKSFRSSDDQIAPKMMPTMVAAGHQSK